MAPAASCSTDQRRSRFLQTTLLLAVVACSRTDAFTPNDTHGPSRIELSTSSLTIWTGERDTLRAHVIDAAGKELAAAAVHWESDDSTIASIDSFGVVTGIAGGKTSVTATSAAVSASLAVEVLEAAVVELTGPTTLLVNESADLDVTVRAAGGQAIMNPSWATFTSSDSSLVDVNRAGTVRGLKRGAASISVRVAHASATIALSVGARFALNPPYPVQRMNVLDALHLSAVYLDVNGVAIAERPVASWRSNNPGVVTVTSDGVVTATEAAMARISASTEVDTAFADVSVDDFRPGQPTTVRYAHALRGVGPITFVLSSGDTASLSFGESAQQPVAPGTYLIHADVPGYGQQATQVVLRDGDNVTVYALYAMGATPSVAYLQQTWSRRQNLPPEWGKLRVVQGSQFLTYFLRPTGEPIAGLPDECYFDGGNVHEPFGALAPGDYDIIATTKYPYGPHPPQEIARLPVAVPSGRTITAVMFGGSAVDAGVLVFIDP